MIDTQKMGHPSEMPVGNEAKLRETLVAVKKSIDEIGASSLDGDPEILMMSLTQVCARLSARIDAALAAPPRNCDKFGGDYKMLHTAWFDWTGSPSGQNADGTVKLTFDEWLLASATEQEGGAK